MSSHDRSPWSLDPQLAADTVAVGDLALCRVLLNDDSNFPWLILVPRRPSLVELIDLDETDLALLMSELAQVSAALKAMAGCDKLNVAALGNVVAQLHVHVIARFRTDAAWPNPVWGKVLRRAYAPDARDKIVADLQTRLAIPPISLAKLT